MIKTIQMTPADQFTDNYGGVFPNALVKINNFESNVYYGGTSKDGDSDYTKTNRLSVLTYSVNFWYETKLEHSKRSQPLMFEGEGGEFEFTFVVDADKYNSMYQNAPGDHHDGVLLVAERHFRNEVIPLFKG